LAEELFYIRLNGRICTKKKLSVPPSGRLISIRWNGSQLFSFLFALSFALLDSIQGRQRQSSQKD
jgi:hypothetical protein